MGDITTTVPNSAKKAILPFWIVLDESLSMDHNGGLKLLNDALPKIHGVLRDHPAISDVAHLAIVAFAGSAHTIVDLCDLSKISQIPSLVARKDGTNYAGTFEHVRDAIGRDVAILVADGYAVYRPAVFFFSDGEPNVGGDWRPAHARLVDPDWQLHPNVIAFGFEAAAEAVIKEVGSLCAYMADPGTDVATAVAEFATVLMRTILTSASTGALAVPTQVPGFHLAGASIVA